METDLPTKDTSRRVFRLCQDIKGGNPFLDTCEILRLLDEEWSQLCRFLRTNVTVQRISLPIHRIRRSHTTVQRDLYAFLRSNRNLTHIILTSQDVEEADWMKTFVAALSKSPTVEMVEFRRLQVKDPCPDMFVPLQDAVAFHSLTTMQVDTATLASLLEAIQKFEWVNHWKIHGGATSIFAPMLSGDVSVKHMTLQGHVWSTDALISLANLTATNHSVRDLEVQAYVSRNDYKSDPVPPHFVTTMGDSNLENLELRNLNWSRVSPVELTSLARNTRLRSLSLHDVTDEQARALLRSTFEALTVMTISVDWVTTDTINAAVECMTESASLIEIKLEGSGIPSLKFDRSPHGRLRCLLDSSFCPIQWDIITEWMLQCSFDIDFSYVLRSLNENDVIAMSCLLTECYNLVKLDLFWSSSFSSDCSHTFTQALERNTSLISVKIDKPHPPAQQCALNNKAKYVTARNRVGNLLRSPELTTSLWPVVFHKGNLSTTFLALQDGSLTDQLRR